MSASDPWRRRHLVTVVALVLGFCAVLGRLFTLQVLQAADLTERADRQHERTVTVEGVRGAIYDREGRVLALNMDVPSVFGVPTALDNPIGTARDLARVLNVRTDELERKLKQDRSFVWLARKLDPDQGRTVESLSLKGIGTVLEGRRFYPKGPLLSHVLGFTGVDGQGLEGLERRYEPVLRGGTHRVVLQRDALGHTVFPKDFNEQGPSPGHSLRLTIDEVVQYLAEKELEEGVLAAKAKGGMLVAMDPKTGAILAMALYPKFDPNAVRGLTPDRWRNRILTDAYEPGSTLKVITAAAALDAKVMTPGTLIFGEHGEYAVAGRTIHDHEKQGWMTFAQMVQKSSNVGAAKAGIALGEERLYRYVKAFGFGERTDIDLPGEAAGLVREPREWGKQSLTSIAFGQEIGVTPLQLTAAVSAIANGGWLMRPYVVAEVRDGHGEPIVQAGPLVRKRAVSADTAQAMTAILEGVVTNGTGGKAAVPGVRVAGKTGTAQKIDPQTGRYSPTQFVASFVGFAPADDPRLTMIVVIDEPRTEQWGGAVAAPVFRRVAEQALPHLGVTPQAPLKVAQGGGAVS